jgi:cell division protein FtsZ
LLKVIAEGLRDADEANKHVRDPRGPCLLGSTHIRFDPPESDPSAYRIKIVGVGGCGCNMVSRMNARGVIGAELILMNTDAQHLLMSRGGRKVLLGRSVCGGLGTKRDIDLGEKAAVESEKDVREILGNPEIVFILCGLGGGTSSGAAPVVARIASETGAMAVVLCTTPFLNEGRKVLKIAKEGLKRLMDESDLVVAFPNMKLLTLGPKVSLNCGFSAPAEAFIRVIRGITEGYATTDDKNCPFLPGACVP